MNEYTVTRMSERLTRFDDAITSSCYVLEGSQRYALIDTGAGEAEDLREQLQAFTDKPMVLLVTHAHADHYANAGLAGRFEKVYMHPEDIAILPEMNRFFSFAMADKGRDVQPEALTPLREGEQIDLGELCLEVIEMPGHTPGSICFLERSLGLLFTGDSVGSGGEFWMQLPRALPISQLRENLAAFMEKLPEGALCFLGGHFSQAGVPGSEDYKPVTKERLRELLHVCDALLGGDETLEVRPYPGMGEENRLAVYGNAQMVYVPERL